MNEQELERQATLSGLLNDPGVPIANVINLLEQDRELSARILTMANSANYGTRRRVTSLRLAVVLIGFRKIRTLIEERQRRNAEPARKLKEGEAGA